MKHMSLPEEQTMPTSPSCGTVLQGKVGVLYHPCLGDGALLSPDFYKAAMVHYRASHPSPAFLVLSDDMAWCREHLMAPDTYLVGDPRPEVDLAVMALCNASIIGGLQHLPCPSNPPDYGTFGLWGAVLAGGPTVVSNRTFR